MLIALLLLVPLTALGLVLGMGRLEDNLLQAPAADDADVTTGASL
ncbi:hypothetical protein [Aquipuribacter hungaricus]|uniref:Uncharacterized protein n=1 Tax=Aquipuribacter hungaricus TaxID=545624 RepID=A0ABV7WD93_9MICO